MSFVLTKLLFYLIVPPSSLFIIIALGALIGFRRILGRVLVLSGFLLLYLLCLGPVADALLIPLEQSEPALTGDAIRADAVVVLGGGVHDLSWMGLSAELSCTALSRLVKGAALSRKYRIPLVLMGGNGDPSRDVEADAEVMARAARAMGFPAKDMVLEKKSRNTLESARSLPELIKGRRIVLVTSAYHIKRASAMFRKHGFQVVPAAAGYLAEKRPVTLWSLIPHAAALSASSAACSEYVSLFWYRLSRNI